MLRNVFDLNADTLLFNPLIAIHPVVTMKLPFRALLCTAGMSAALGVLSPISALAATDAAAQPADTPSAEIQLETEAEPEISLLGEQVIDGHWCYIDDATGQKVTGMVQLPGKTVYYGPDGAMRYGLQVVPGYGLRYFDTITGAMATNCWVATDTGTYRAGSDGAFLTGEQAIDGGWYWLDPDAAGARAAGFTDIPDNRPGKTTKTVFYDENGRMQYGERCVDGRWYHFDEVYGEMSRGLTDLPAGKTVYYGDDGAMRYGAQDVPGLGLRYFDRITGALLTNTWGDLGDGTLRFFDGTGAATGYLLIADAQGSYLTDGSSERLTGMLSIGGTRFYADPETGMLASGWITVDGSTYYADPSTHMLMTGEAVVDGSWHLFDDDGRMRTGFVTLGGGGGAKTVYYGDDGAMRYGEQAIDGRWYYFDTITGKMRVGWKYLENGDKWVWYGSDGAMLYGNQVVDDGRTIHFDMNTGAAQIPVTERQRRVADQAKRCDTYGLSGGWCQAWISRTYRRAGESADSRACAYEAMRAWRVSTSRGGIPVGATVYSKSRSGSHGWTDGVYYEDYGHVGIYVGGGQVASLMYGLVYLEPVEVWTESDGYFGWGWNGGIAL